MGKKIFYFNSCTSCLQFQDVFPMHLSFHQFGVATKRGCKSMVCGIRCGSTSTPIRLFCKLTWLTHSILCLELCFRNYEQSKVKLPNLSFSFAHLIFLNSFFYFTHHSQRSKVIVTPSIINIYQGDPLSLCLSLLIFKHYKQQHISCLVYFPPQSITTIFQVLLRSLKPLSSYPPNCKPQVFQCNLTNVQLGCLVSLLNSRPHFHLTLLTRG